MGVPAAVAGDRITGACVGHQAISPFGNPVPAPPLPFSAPVLMGVATTVFIGAKPVAVAGSSGLAAPPHVGLHASDPFMNPGLQRGTVVSGSPTVLVEGRPMASLSSSCSMCLGPATTLAATAATVLVG